MSIEDRDYMGGAFERPEDAHMSEKQRRDHDEFMRVMNEAVQSEARAIAAENEKRARWVLERTLPRVMLRARYLSWPQWARKAGMRALTRTPWPAPAIIVEGQLVKGFLTYRDGTPVYVAYDCPGCEVCNGS
jgi:hypothetical protein